MAIVAFDLDDTLFTEMDFVRSGYRAVAESFADDDAEREHYYRMFLALRPRGFEEARADYRARHGKEARLTVDDMVYTYRHHRPELSLFPGARKALEDISRAGHRLVLVTDGSTLHQRSKFNALGLADLFDPADIFVSEETGGDKTSGLPWTLIEKRHTAPGQRFYYVGDNLSKDFRLPRRRGWTTIMKRDTSGSNVFPQRPADWPAENRPHTAFDDYADLPKFIF